MFPLRKRKPESAAPLETSAWHPDFRVVERLPDTKVIRTAFFTNGIPIVIAVLCAVWFVANELRLRDLNSQIGELQREIDKNRPASASAIALYKNFQAEAARIAEVDTFLNSKPLISELLLHLAETLPANVALDGLDFQGYAVTLRGTVRGAPDQASGYASSYVQSLKADPTLSSKFDEVTLVNLARNPQTGRLNLEISLRLKGAPAGGKK